MKRKQDPRNELLNLVPQGIKKVLDVGCGNGSLGAKLKEKQIEVVGIERNKDLYTPAKGKLDQVYLADVEKFNLPYPEGYFDCILYADILEHLLDPLATLKNQDKYLKDDGYIVASIPNVRYYKLIIRLLFGGTWDYVDTGILDKTHLRFFTLTNIKELFIRAGYKIIDIRRNIVATRGFRFLNVLCFNKLKDLLTYQFYVVAEKSADSRRFYAKRKIYQF